MPKKIEWILQINKLEDYEDGDNFTYDGYEIVTNKQSVKLLMDMECSCCETPGFFWCNDNPKDFIGSKLLDIKLTDTKLNEAIMKKNDLVPSDGYFEGEIMFVNIETGEGVLQFVAYNKHNGYYGHTALVISEQLSHNGVL